MKHARIKATVILIMMLVMLSQITVSAGWKSTSSGKKYITASGAYVKSSWYQIKKKWYYFDGKGRLKTGRFKVNDEYYYVKSSTGKVCNQKIGSYYYGSDGKMIKSKWQKIKKKWFYFGANGKIRYGKININGSTYYCQKKSGKVTNRKIGDYYYNKTGIMVKNQWIGAFYYGSDGKIKTGKFSASDGKTYYCKKDTGKVTSSWVNKNYYDKDGVMAVSCWIQDSYVNEKGTITKGNKNPKNPPTKEEIRWLAAITYLEAGNQSYYGKQCVASVVMNRVNSKKFPNTIKGVLFQSGQFTPAANGTLTKLYKSKKAIQAQCMKAAEYVLEHGSVLKGYYYFNTFSGRLKVGDHYFT